MRRPKERICDELIGERIKSVLDHEGKKQADLAKALGITSASVSSMCAGRTAPSVQTITLICQMYGVRKEWLCTGTGSKYVNMDLRDDLKVVSAEIAKGITEDSPKARLALNFSKKILEMDDEQLKQNIDTLKLLTMF